MMPTAECPYCAANLPVPEQLLGKKARCPCCRGVVVMAAPVGRSPATPPPQAIAPAASRPEPDAVEVPMAELASAEDVTVVGASECVLLSAPPRDGRMAKRPKRKKRRGGWRPPIAIEGWVLRALVGGVGLLICCGLILLGVKVATRASPPPEIPAALWQPFEVPGHCRALMPGTPIRQPMQQAGVSMVMYLYETPDKDQGYGVGYLEDTLPPPRCNLPAETLLTDACDGATRNTDNMGGREVSRESIKLGSIPGKQLKTWIAKANGHMISRLYLVNGRLYMVLCGGRGVDVGQPNVNRFFDSFEILEGDPQQQSPAQRGGGLRPGLKYWFDVKSEDFLPPNDPRRNLRPGQMAPIVPNGPAGQPPPAAGGPRSATPGIIGGRTAGRAGGSGPGGGGHR